MNRVIHFEIQADEPERAAKFYTDVFGWEIKKWEGMGDYWMVTTAPEGSKDEGINGGLLKRPMKAPAKNLGANAFVCTIDIENFDEMSKKVVSAGGSVMMAKSAIPGMAWLGYFTDTEGNGFGLFQADKEAK